jgi:hypothetical protein
VRIPVVGLVAGLWLSVTSWGCGHDPLPAALTPAPQNCGNPCASRMCPSAYTCRVDAHCGARCDPESVGNKMF